MRLPLVLLIALALGPGCKRAADDTNEQRLARADKEAAELEAKLKAQREADDARRAERPAESAKPAGPVASTTWTAGSEGPTNAELDRVIASAKAKDVAARKQWAAAHGAKFKMHAAAVGQDADELSVATGGCPLIGVVGFREGPAGQEARKLGFRTYRMDCGNNKVCISQLDSGKYECH